MSDNLLICGHCVYHKGCLLKTAIQQKIINSKDMFQGREGAYIPPEFFCEFYKGQNLPHRDIKDSDNMPNKGET